MSLRVTLAKFIEHPRTAAIITAVIVFNAIILGLETSPDIMAQYGPLIKALDTLCLSIFVAELLAKLVAHGPRFFRSGWNIFDFVIIAISLIPAGQGFSAMRALRILRVLRVVSVAPSLRRVVEGLITAMPGMGSVFMLMGLIFYIGSVIATKLFSEAFPEWFGSLGASAYTLFQIMTLESWSMGIVRPVMKVYPHAWAFFLPFILVTTFAVVNLLVGLVVNSMQDAHHTEDVANTDAYRDDVKARLDAIDKKLNALAGERKG
ncbi:ion transporter [uncultured Lentibacter sp.]|jgi:voltage-gated sodium channel|uniref:ion transporter n=1 Tax=uncultured Lentibacter sp. TaxID=1659309 RepID=UPI00262D46AC|nr:ion transporter [uncultured Lentibacter sp.]